MSCLCVEVTLFQGVHYIQLRRYYVAVTTFPDFTVPLNVAFLHTVVNLVVAECIHVCLCNYMSGDCDHVYICNLYKGEITY